MNERYSVVSVFHEYPFGRVCLVEDQIISKNYVAKELFRHSDPLLIHQFRVEVDVLSQLRHPNVPEIIDVFETENAYVIIETYIEGQTLDKWLLNHKCKQTLNKKWILTCLDILECIHQIGYLYIDVKPENLIIHDNEVYMIDFNACISFEASNVILASKINEAPEYRCKRNLDQSSDVYSMGGLINLLFPFGPVRWVANKCRKRQSKKRYQTIGKLKVAFLKAFSWRKYVAMLVLVILLSVLLPQYLNSESDNSILKRYLRAQDPTLFIGAYNFTLTSYHENHEENVQDNLYEWINNEWIFPEIYHDKNTAGFLLKQAILSQNPSLCSYILDRIDKDTQNDLKELIVLIKAYLLQRQEVSYEIIHEYIVSIDDLSLTNRQKMEKLLMIVNVLLESEIVLEQHDLDVLYDLQSSLDWQEHQKMFESLAKIYVNYGMLIKNENLNYQIPQVYHQLFDKTSEIGKLIEVLEGD